MTTILFEESSLFEVKRALYWLNKLIRHKHTLKIVMPELEETLLDIMDAAEEGK